MSNLAIKDGLAVTKYLDATGAGTDDDPYVPAHLEANSTAILVAAQAIQAAAVAIRAAVETLDNIVAGSEAQVDIVSAPTVTVQGTVTASGPLTDTQLRATAVPTSLAAFPGTVAADITAIKTAAEILDNAIAGTEMQVDVVTLPALPAGSNNIGDVDVVTLPGTVQADIAAIKAAVEIIDNVVAGAEAQVDVLSIAAGETHLGEVGGHITRVDIEMARPADTTGYTAGDVVSNATTGNALIVLSNLARVNAGSGYIVRAALATNKKSITPRFRVHLFNASNPTFVADNVPHKELYADSAKRLGYFDLAAMMTPVDATNSDLSRTFDNNLRIPVVCAAASRTLYVLLETLDAFTPASGEVFTLSVWMDNN